MDEEQQGSERRDFLKKMAVGGAVAWTAPVVLSSKAGAAETGSPAPTTSSSTTVPEVCIGRGDWECGEELVICGDAGLGGICICEVDLEGNDICWGNFPCADPRAIVCEENSDCEPGWKCATTCCGTTCVPPCDGTFSGDLRVSRNTRTAAGV
jgi:hypothetical protein